MRLLRFLLLFYFFSFCLTEAIAVPRCALQLSATSAPQHLGSRKAAKRVRVSEINDVWNERYRAERFWSLVPQILSRIPKAYGDKVDFLLHELDVLASVGRLKNLNEWIENVIDNDSAQVMSFIAEAEYAVYILRQNLNYVVTFEPEGGFYRAHTADLQREGIKQKSIDLRIHDRDTGELIALREIKSSSSRARPGDNLVDAFQKVHFVRQLNEPELANSNNVEIGLVYFYDYDPHADLDPASQHPISKIQDQTLRYLESVQKSLHLSEQPFDTVTIIDFGSRRVVHIKRLQNDTLEATQFPLAGNSFIAFEPKITAAEAVLLLSQLH